MIRSKLESKMREVLEQCRNHGYIGTLDKTTAASKLVGVTTAQAKLSLLESELKKNSAPLFASTTLALASLVSVLFTQYWVIVFLLFVPFALQYAEHEWTLRAALKRAKRRAERERWGKP